MTDRNRNTINYVRFGGGIGQIQVRGNLGVCGSRLGDQPQYGVRRALSDAAFGYVSGFPVSAILYYCFTRSLSPWIWKRTLAREEKNRA